MPESRREFFKRFTTSKIKTIPETPMENRGDQLEKIASRRDFVKALGIIAATLATGENLRAQENPGQGQDQPSHPPQSQSEQPVENIDEKEFSFDETLMEQSLVIVAKKIVSTIFTKLDIEHGNKAINTEELMKKINDKPIETYLKSAVFFPIVEELIFRKLPSSFASRGLEKENDKAWGVGITTSAIFSAMHNITDRDPPGNLKFVTNSIPIEQFMGGLFYWYLIRERGLPHSILAHSMNNTVAFAQLLLKSYPNKTRATSILET